jgi:hypothetical protein
MSLVNNDTVAWTPSDACRIAPTLVVFCGSISAEEERFIRYGVQDRLGDTIPSSVVQWGRFKFAQDVSEAALRKLTAPLVRSEFWDDLVARKYLSDVPRPLFLQIIAICESSEEEVSRLLQDLAAAAQSALADRAELSMTLIALGNGPIDLGQAVPYWPCIRLQEETYSGALANRARIVEVAQTLVVAWVTSEVERAIRSAVGPNAPSGGWIWMGASALIVDLADMRDYLRLRILQDMLHPLVATRLELMQQQALAQDIKARVSGTDDSRGLQKKRWEGAKAIISPENKEEKQRQLRKLGWGIEETATGRAAAQPIKPFASGGAAGPPSAWSRVRATVSGLSQKLKMGKAGGLSVERCVLSPRLEQKLTQFTPTRQPDVEQLANWQQKQEQALPRLADLLKEYYRRTRNELMERLPEDADRREYVRLVRFCAALLDGKWDPADVDVNSRAMLLELREKYAVGGLAAAIYAMENLAQALRDTSDADWRGKVLEPHPMEGDDYLNALAESDAADIQADSWRYIRFRETLLSWPGWLFKLVPAWMLLTGACIAITGWEEGQAAAFAAAGLALLGGIEAIYWRGLLRSHLKEFQARAHAKIETSFLRLMPTLLGDYRLLIVRHLEDLVFALKQLRFTLEHMDADVQKRLTGLKAPQREESTVYRLADFKRCDEWADKAIEEQVESYRHNFMSKVTELIINQVFGASERQPDDVSSSVRPLGVRPQPAAYYRVARSLEHIAAEGAKQSFLGSDLEPNALAEVEEPLEGEKRWSWLYWKAHPLGKGPDESPQSFTIVTLASDAALKGAAGESLRQSNWRVARSRQPQEIICLRGVVEAA